MSAGEVTGTDFGKNGETQRLNLIGKGGGEERGGRAMDKVRAMKKMGGGVKQNRTSRDFNLTFSCHLKK